VDVALVQLAQRQEDLVARWQLLAAGWTPGKLEHHITANAWRVIHTGVYALTQAALTQRQRWIAATLTAPGTFLSHASAAACWQFRPFEGAFEVVTRQGNGGPRRVGALLVCRSSVLLEDVTTHEGISITTAERTLLDLSPSIGTASTRRAFREALRLKCTSTRAIEETAARHRHRKGASLLGDLARHYAILPYHRARSDAESRGLEVVHDAGKAVPEVNIDVAGEEADFVWRDRRVIVEIDGPQFHLFPDEDLRKQRVWERAGYDVRRIPSGPVYSEPDRLVALAPE
jgi:hypothetical protein